MKGTLALLEQRQKMGAVESGESDWVREDDNKDGKETWRRPDLTVTLRKLVADVATPGGTTEAGLRLLDNGWFTEDVGEAVAQAAARCMELGAGSNSPHSSN